jgi:hypothetical protein
MTARRATTRAALIMSTVACALIVGACGGTAGTPAATPVPTVEAATGAPATAASTEEPVEEPTEEPVEEPTEEASTPVATAEPVASGTLANTYEDIRAYYESEGFDCQDQTPSSQAQGWLAARCLSNPDPNGLTTVIGLVVDPDGVLGDAFAGVVAPADQDMPQATDLISPLAFLAGATLGELASEEAATWLAANLGSEMAQTQVNGNTVATYTQDDENGVGAYIEIATPAFMDAPAP